MKHLRIRGADNPAMAAERLGARVLAALSAAIRQRGEAWLVVSGGSTPIALFHYLSSQPIAWDKVSVTLTDERCVAVDDLASNAGLVRKRLLTKHAKAARFIGLFDGAGALRDAETTAERQLRPLPCYDVVILGMGEDGHTASIFPRAANRDLALQADSLRLALLIDPVTASPLRITQTVARLLRTRHLALHFTGPDKARLFKRILGNPDARQWPVAAFLTQTEVPAEIYTDADVSEAVGA